MFNLTLNKVLLAEFTHFKLPNIKTALYHFLKL